MSSQISRRRLIFSTIGLGAGTLVAACSAAPAAPTPQPVPTAPAVEKVVTQIVEKQVTQVVEKQVTQVVEKQVTQIVQVTPVPGPQTRVTYYVWGNPLAPGRYALYEQGFAQQNQNIILQSIIVPDNPDYYTKLLTAVAAKQTPDMVLLEGQYLRKFTKDNAVQSVDPYIATDKFDLSQYYDSMVNLGRVGGKLYAFPLGSGPYFLWYWKKQFQDAGLPDPYTQFTSGQWSYQAYHDAAKALTKVNAQGQAQQLGSGEMLSVLDIIPATSFLASAGASMLNSDWTQTTVDQGKGPEVLQSLVDLTLKDKVTPGQGLAQTVGTASDQFSSWQGRFLSMATSHFVTPGWEYDRDKKQFAYDDFGFVPYPKYNAEAKHSVVWAGSGYSMSQSTKNPDATWTVMKWMFSEPGIKVWLDSTYFHMCPLKSLATSDYYLSRIDPKVFDVTKLLDMLDTKYQVLDPTPLEYFDWIQVVKDQFDAARLGKKSISQMITDLKSKGDPILAKGV